MGALITAKENFHAVSLSGGKDSTCLLLLMIERGLPIDAVIWADTGMEFPEMYGISPRWTSICTESGGYTSPPCALPRASST